MLNFLRIFRHKNLLKIAVLAALIGFGNSLWSEKYIWNENAKSDVLRPYTWSSKVDGENSNSIWKKESPDGSWGYLTSTPEMTLSDNILFSGECTVIVQLEKDISVDKIIMAYEQGAPYPVTSGAYPVTIDLNGYNLTCNDLILNNNGNFPVNLTIKDSNATKGNFIIKNGFDFSDNQTHTINITQGANLKIEGTVTGATSGTGSVTIDSSDKTGKLEVTGNVENNGKGFNTNAENLDVTSSIFIWTGAKDTVWEDAANWSTGTVPAKTAEVAIPDGLTNYPTIAAGKNIVVKSLAMGDSAKITVEGTLSIDSDFTINNRITGPGSLVVPDGITYTVPAITVGVGIVNNGTVDCETSKVQFTGVFTNGTTGTFKASASEDNNATVFLNTADFRNGDFVFSGDGTAKSICFYNKTDNSSKTATTFYTSTENPLTVKNFFFGGNVNITLGNTLNCTDFSSDCLGNDDYFNRANFTVNITGGEIKCKSMTPNRGSKTDGVIGTININTDISCKGQFETHSGTNIIIAADKTVNADSFRHSADSSEPYTKLTIYGSLNVQNTFDLQYNSGSTEILIGSSGKLIANEITKTNGTYTKSTGKDSSGKDLATGYSITNNGTIQVGTSLNLPASFKIKNNGIIKDKDSSTGAKYTFAGTYDNSSTGTLIVDGGSVTNTAAEITIKNLTLKNSNTINGTQKITVTNATYTDSTNLAIIGTVELPGVTNGDVTIGNATTAGTATFTSPYQLDTLTITNGTLTPAASSTNKINTRLTNNGTYTDSTGCTLQLADGATIDGTPASGSNNLPNLTVECLGSATFDCSNIINTLKAESRGGKTLSFTTDTFQTVTKLFLSGSSTTDTLSLTGSGIWEINIENPNNASVKWVTIENSTANQSSLKQIFAEESFDNGNNTNWDFAITYKWTGAKDYVWEDAANWTPANYGYPGSTTTAHNVLIPDGLAAEKYPVYTNITNKIKTLKIGESEGSAATLTLNANNLQVDDEDAGTADLSNYGTIIFTNAGRITDSSTTPVPIMDNAKGTVEYSTGTTCNITDYHNGNNGTADYYNLVIKSGRWTIPASATGSNNNIKAANSFTIEYGATLIIENTSEINSSFTNNGTIEIKDGTSENPTSVGFWGNFTNSSTGKVKQNNYTTIWISGSCETVDDYGTWTFGTDADISFNMFPANSSFNVKSAAAATNNKYNLFIPYNAEHNITFKGFDSSNPMKIAKWTDTGVTSESLSFDFQNVDFLDNETGFTFNSNITASSGNLTFSDDATFVKKTTFATSDTITVETRKTITAQKDFEVTNGTVDLKGSITTTHVALKLNTVQVSNNASLSAKKITITGSIEPKTAADSSRWNLSLTTTGSSDDDTISVGSDTGAEISIGTDDKLFKDITLTTTNQNITFGETCKLHAAGTISATGKNVTFNNSIISNALVVNATEEVSLNGLKAKSFTVTGTTTTPTAVKYEGLIKLYGTSDFIIDYPAITTDNVEFELGGNFVLQDKPTPYTREGSIVPDVDYNSATPRTLKITTPPNSEIQLHKNVGSSDHKFTSVNFYSPVNFAAEDLTLYAETSNFAEKSSLNSTNKFAISKHLKIGGTFTYSVDEQFNIPGNCTIDSTGISTFENGVAVGGSFTDNGKWETDTDKGTITFIGSDAATFKASENSTYNIVLNNSYKELTFINSKANVSKLTVTNAAALKFQCDADIGTFSNTADSLKLEIGYIDASNSSNNKSAKVTINNLDGNTLNSKTAVINSELDFKQTSEGVTLGSNDSEITIAGSITAAHDITLLGTITSVEVDDASKETLPKITAGSDKAINLGSTTSDQVTYSGPNLYLNSSVNNTAKFINSGILTANQSFTNTNNGSAIGTSSSAILNLKKDFTDNGKWESEETLVINGTGTQNFTPQSTGSTYNKILIQKTADATDHEVIFTAPNTLKAKTVTIGNNDTTNFNGPVSIGTLNDVADSSTAPGSITINGGGTISTATLNTTGDLTVTSDAGLTITNLTHTTGETKVNGKLTLAGDSTVGKITIAATSGKLQGASGKTITVLGHWTNNGTFTANAGIVTFDGSIIIAGTSNFNTANMAGTISITSANQYETLNIYNSSSTDNSVPANPVTEITPSQITFPAGPTNVQTVTTALFLKGNSAEKLLQLKSSSSTPITDTTEADCFYINFTGTITDTDESKNPDIQFVEMTNGYNASGEPDVHNYITTYNSVDSGNNYFWNFNGCEYTWTGTKNTDWFTAKNWNRNSVPGKNSIILITEKVNGASVTNWPDLDKSTYPNGVSKVDMGLGEITIGQKAELHINRKNLAASTITNSGLVKIKGTDAAQTITGERVNIAGSTVEYYSGTTATPTINFAWGNEYANLLITDVTNNSSDLEISEELIIHNNTALSGKLAVTGTTTIETTENVSLTGSNSLAGGVVINKVNDAVLNNNGTFNLTQTAGADINTLTINSPVTLKTNVITTSSQTYNDEITLTKATELTVSNSTPADLLTINNKLSGSTYALSIDANTSFTSEEKVTAGYIKSAGTKDRTWTSTTNANLDSDLYIDCDTNKIIFDGNFTANNIYMYNGAVTVKSGKTLEALHNLAVWGAAYSATDKRYSANNTRFEYYTAPAFSFAYTQDSRTTTFDSLAGSTIKVGNNFYLNGTDLPSVTLDLPANTSSKPELNTTAAVTEKQWGLPYAAIFNSAITGVTANTGYVTAAVEQGNTDKGGNNQNLQFEIPQIAQAYTVYDDVIYVEFTLPVENAHNEINTNLGAGATAESNGELSKGGLWYNNKEYRFHPVAYTDKDCTAELEASSEGVTSFYLKTIHTETNTAASYWNTDADGEYAYNQIATNPLESTDRNGIHHNITVDLSMLEGMFTSAKGHTMSSNYGINFEADGSIEAEGFTATQDKCSPVLLAVYTGQENHIPDSDIQPDYDAHNFVEFLYSEPVDIGNETTALKAEDGENNIQASATLGGITGAGVGTGITPATGKGLTIAGLAAFTDGRLNPGNKLDSSSPHSLYRNFSTSVSQSAEKQTNRIRVSIAGYIDGTIDGTHKNWIGYIDYSEMPANGSTVRAIENDYLTDTNGNSIDVKGTQTNHKIATEFKLNQGAKNETLNAIYGSWDTSAPVFSQIRKIRNDYADEYEIVPTGNGSVIDKLEFHILDNEENGNNTYFVFTHGWSQMLDAPDSEGYRYSLKPGFQAADKFGGSRAFANGAARTGGGIRYSSYYNMQSAFKFGIHSDAEPVYNFTAITPGATSSYFTGSSNDAYPIPSTDDNNYISLEISGSSYSYEVQFSISYDNTNAYITDLAGNRLQNALMSSIDRTPPDFDITLAPVGGNTHGNGELYIVFVKKLKLENISVGSYTHEKLVDVLPSIVQFGTINSSFTEDTSLKVESAQVYEPLTVTGTHKGDKEFTAFKLTLNRAVTLDDIKTKYIRIAFPASESEYSLDPFTLAAGARVTYIQDFDGISYLQMYKAHPLSDFAINVINPEYAYDPDYTGDNAASMMRSPDDENGSWAVHDWSKDQKNFGTLPYGGQINLITNTTSDGDSDDSNDAGVPATQSFTLYLSKAPTAESVSTHFNNDFDTKKRIWLPQVAGTPAFEPLSDVLNENFETVLHTAAPDFDEEKYPNRIQFNFNQKDYDWNSGDQIQFLFGLNGTSIMHSPDNTNDGSSYTGISSPIYALRTSNILNPDIQTLDLWSFKLKDVKTQRGGVSIYNNVINVLKGERTTIKVSMPRKGNLKVIVMTLDGNVISYLENSNNVSGDHIYTWNGTNKKGNMVARGLYFIRVIGEGIDETRKVMCINEK